MKLEKVRLSDFTSIKIGGECDMVRVKSEEELLEVLVYARNNNKKIFILGLGTNTFFEEELANIIIIKIENKGLTPYPLSQGEGEYTYVLLTASAGVVWDDVVKYAIKNNLWGIENLSYIPGTAGAAPVQNIGAYGVEICDVLDSVLAFDLEKHDFIRISKDECDLVYRGSIFKTNPNRYIVWEIRLKLSTNKNPILTYSPLDTLLNSQDDENLLQNIRELVIKTRKSKIPDYNIYPNSGSFFKNPIITEDIFENLLKTHKSIPHYIQNDGYKLPSAWLIDNIAKMKGVKDGDFGTWPAQPLVIINYNNGKAKDLLSFSDKIIEKIKSETGITLEREVNYVR